MRPVDAGVFRLHVDPRAQGDAALGGAAAEQLPHPLQFGEVARHPSDVDQCLLRANSCVNRPFICQPIGIALVKTARRCKCRRRLCKAASGCAIMLPWRLQILVDLMIATNPAIRNGCVLSHEPTVGAGELHSPRAWQWQCSLWNRLCSTARGCVCVRLWHLGCFNAC